MDLNHLSDPYERPGSTLSRSRNEAPAHRSFPYLALASPYRIQAVGSWDSTV